MAKVQERQGVKGKTYRVEFMREGSRVSKTFRLKKEAEKFAALITLNADLANTLANVTLNTLTLQKAIAEYLDSHTGKDTNVNWRLNWWCNAIGADKLIGKITKQDLKAALQSMLDNGMATATHNRYKSAISSVFEFVNWVYLAGCMFTDATRKLGGCSNTLGGRPMTTLPNAPPFADQQNVIVPP